MGSIIIKINEIYNTNLGGVDLDNTIVGRIGFKAFKKKHSLKSNVVNLSQGKINVEYTIKKIDTEDSELRNFLFTLGCYEGELVTLISILSDNYIISVKDARYSIDKELAKVIII